MNGPSPPLPYPHSRDFRGKFLLGIRIQQRVTIGSLFSWTYARSQLATLVMHCPSTSCIQLSAARCRTLFDSGSPNAVLRPHCGIWLAASASTEATAGAANDIAGSCLAMLKSADGAAAIKKAFHDACQAALTALLGSRESSAALSG